MLSTGIEELRVGGPSLSLSLSLSRAILVFSCLVVALSSSCPSATRKHYLNASCTPPLIRPFAHSLTHTFPHSLPFHATLQLSERRGSALPARVSGIASVRERGTRALSQVDRKSLSNQVHTCEQRHSHPRQPQLTSQ
jgi:hypothetical protein